MAAAPVASLEVEDIDELQDEPVLEDEGLTPSLEVAAWKGKLADVRHYLRLGVDPNAMVTEEEDTMLHHTPLMAAAAADSMDAVVELLLAGADPDLPSPTGVTAADLAGNRGIMKILALFSHEVEVEAKQAASAALDADTEEIRRRALVAVKGKGLNLLRRVLKPGSLVKFLNPEPSPEPQPQPQPGPQLPGPQLPGPQPQTAPEEEPATTGLSAREARKQRQEAAERERLRKVAEKAAKRRGQDEEELEKQRLARVAEKVAARRELDPEEARLQKIAQRAALRRQVSLRTQKSGEELSTCTALALLPEDGDQGRVRIERKKTAEVAQCFHCGQSGERKECGLCGEMGMCGICSMCALCGRVSGFCSRPEVHARPGMYGLSGMPNLSGLSAEELQTFEPPTGSPTEGKKKKKKKRKRKGGSDDSASSGPDVVAVPKASPKDGDSDADEATCGMYFVDNKEYKAPSAGMAFRYSKNLTDAVKDMRKFAAWGTTVTGWDQGDGWLKVGDFFLPFQLDGKKVLTFKASAEQAKLKKRPPAGSPQPAPGSPADP